MLADVQKAEIVKEGTPQRAIWEQFTSTDENLDREVFANLPMKFVDFYHDPKASEMIASFKTETKKQMYVRQFEKLRIMFELAYTRDMFQDLKMFKLNSE